MALDLGILLLFCVWGCGMTCYRLGRRAGIEDAVEQMVRDGLVQLDDE
jgi:hypothetical protein